nr:copia protein [Tanacetum cinerariifolium]
MMVKEQGELTQINNDDFYTCMLHAFFLKKNPRGNKKDERGIVVRNKARLVAQGHTQEEGIDYKEVFAPVARIEAIRLFLAYASFMGFMVYEMDVKSAFRYGTIKEEVYVCQPPGFEDPDYPDKVYKVVKALYGLHQAPRACQDKYVAEFLRKFGLTDGKSAGTPIDTKKPLLKDPDGEDVDVHTYSNYAGASLDRKSTIRGYQFLGCRLISWQCKKQTVVATSSTKAEYVAAASYCAQYVLMVNPTIYVSCIKQFWSSVSLKKTNDVVRLQALIDRRKVIITEDTVRQALRLDNADSVDCLTNEEIFAQLVRMGYEKPSTKLTFYKAFFLAQWNLVRNVDRFSKFYMYPRFLQLMINAQVGDLSSHTIKYTSPALTQKVFANMRRVGKGFSRVDTPLFEGILVPQQVPDGVANDVVNADAEPTPPLPIPATIPPTQQELIPSSLQVESTPPPSPHQSPIAQPSSPLPQQPPSHDVAISMDLLNQLLETCATLTEKVGNLERMNSNREKIAELDADEDVTLEEVAAEVAKDADDDEAEPVELSEVIEVVTTAKLMTEVVTAAAAIITTAPMPKASAIRRRKGVVIRDPEETATPSVIVHSEPKSKDKGKGILVEKPKPLKKQAHIEQDEAYARELEAELNANIN